VGRVNLQGSQFDIPSMGMGSPIAPKQDVNLLIPTSARTVLFVGCGDGSLGHALKRDRNIEVSGIEM